MGLFGKKSKEEKKSRGGCCDMEIVEETEDDQGSGSGTTVIEIMGPGCKKCEELYQNTLQAVEASGKSIKVDHVTDIEKLAISGVMSTPALLVNGKIVSSGKVLKPNEVKQYL